MTSRTPGVRPGATYRFNRPFSRIIIDGIVPVVGCLAFLGAAVLLATRGYLFEPGDTGGFRDIGIAMFTIFGGLLGVASVLGLRRGLRRLVLEIGPDGIWTPEMGRLAWNEVAEIRQEQFKALESRGTRFRLALRLGIVPRDPGQLRQSTGSRLATATSKVLSAINNAASLRSGAATALAPYGLMEEEIGAPFHEVVARISEYFPVKAA